MSWRRLPRYYIGNRGRGQNPLVLSREGMRGGRIDAPRHCIEYLCEFLMPTLAQRPCTPCRGGVEPLTRQQCAHYLAEVSDWELDPTARYVKRRFQFRDYRTALAFANAVSALAEQIWHHPELVLGWGFCEVSLTTRKIGGLHESDFVMAARIDALASTPLDAAWLPPLPPPKQTKQ